jgi:uncharacterized UBP type Zn finger protein
VILQMKQCERILMNRLEKLREEPREVEREQRREEQRRVVTNINNFTCKICYIKEINYVFLSCGHLSCECCKSKITTTCPICKSPLKKVQKIFSC